MVHDTMNPANGIGKGVKLSIPRRQFKQIKEWDHGFSNSFLGTKKLEISYYLYIKE
jgi:hypothetical protein